MSQVLIVHVADTLIATVQNDLRDCDALALRDELALCLERSEAQGVILDISVVDTVDSFLGRLINDVALATRLLGAHTVVVGMRPSVAVTLVELGLELKGVHTALNAEKGMQVLRRLIEAERKVGYRRSC